jgi:hypothetical protein
MTYTMKHILQRVNLDKNLNLKITEKFKFNVNTKLKF